MKKTVMILLAAGSFGLAACDNMSSDQRFAAGGLGGAAAGLAAADAMDSSKTGRVVGTLAGAAAGSALASSTAPKQCRYSNGTIAPCPAGY